MSEELLKLDVGGMTCAACVASVERIVAGMDAVDAVAVNLPLNSATIQLGQPIDEEITEEIIATITKAGFTANKQRINQPMRAKMAEQVSAEGRKAALALVLALPTIYLTMFADDMGELAGFDARLLFAGLMTIPVYFWSGMSFHINAWKSIKRGTANMDVLIHLSTTVAFTWSLLATFGGKFSSMPDIFANAEHVFYDGVVFIIGFVLLGNYLEASAKLKATDAIHSLMNLQPKQARVVAEDGYTEMVRAEMVKPESLVKVLVGETIPIDGVLHECKASIDQSTMTGEAYPVRKASGDEVFAGTIVLDGTIVVRTTKSSDDTLLANIIKMVEDAQVGKAPIQRLVDKISAIFVPIVVLLAIVAGIFWATIGPDMIDNPMNSGFELALMVVISTLVIACPCALGLATPIALVVGTGVGAKHGLLIKGIEALEAVHGCNIMVVDKTGTITSGRPRVSHIEIIDCEVKKSYRLPRHLSKNLPIPYRARLLLLGQM